MGSTKERSAAQKLFGDFDAKLAEITDNVLFGDVRERPGLSKRDRSLVTVAALIASNRPEQLRHHLQRARENGATKDEVVEVITHLAFYTRSSTRKWTCDLGSPLSPENIAANMPIVDLIRRFAENKNATPAQIHWFGCWRKSHSLFRFPAHATSIT